MRILKDFLQCAFSSLILFSVCQPAASAAHATDLSTHSECLPMKTVRNIDQLLEQIHRQLDSDCLFSQNGHLLEQQLGVKVFDFSQTENMSDEARQALVNERREFIRDENALYLLKTTENTKQKISILATPAYLVAHGGSLGGSISDGLLPQLLPKPDQVSQDGLGERPSAPALRADTRVPAHPRQTEYAQHSRYIWFNSRKDGRMPYLSIQTGFYPMPSEITVYQNSKAKSAPAEAL